MAKKPTITINQDQLQAAVLTLEHDHRAGNGRPHSVAQGMRAEDVASENAEALWKTLQPKGADKDKPDAPAETKPGDDTTTGSAS